MPPFVICVLFDLIILDLIENKPSVNNYVGGPKVFVEILDIFMSLPFDVPNATER